jgi:putative aminopeptidase FrvX
MKELIRRLCEVYGPSGHEERVRDAIVAEISDVVDDYRVDNLGNLIARKRATARSEGPARKVMLAAHMDEIGVMVTHVDEDGFLRFTPVGGVFVYTLLGSRVVFADGTQGTFGMEGKPLPSEKPERDKLFLDVGAKSRQDVPVGVGDVAVFRQEFAEMGTRMLAPNFDNRISCAVLIQVLREMESSPHDIYAVFTVQEEVGLRGATTAAYGVAPDIALGLDVTTTGDTPEAHTMSVRLGGGPAIKVKDTRMLAHPAVKRLLVNTAQAYDIPYQLEVLEFGSNDASAIQTSREGVASGTVSIPSRYVHTSSQLVDYDDVQNTVKLLVNVLGAPIEL